MKTQPNNKVKSLQKNNGCSIHIKFDHSLFIGDILVNFFVVGIFWLAASFAIYAVLCKCSNPIRTTRFECSQLLGKYRRTGSSIY